MGVSRHSLTHTFFVTLLLIALVPLVGVTIFLVRHSSVALTEQMTSYVQELAQSKAQEIELKLEQVLSHTLIAAQAAELVVQLDMPAEQVEARMQAYAVDQRGLLNLPEETYTVQRNLYPAASVSNIFVGNHIRLTDDLKEDIVTTESLEVILGGIKRAGLNTERVYLTLPSGLMRIYPWEASQRFPADWDPRTAVFYTAALPENNSDGSPVWVGPYLDEDGAQQMVTLSVPLYDIQQQFVGVISQDITIDALTEVILDLQLPGNEGYGFLIDDDGRTIAHPNLQNAALPPDQSAETLPNTAVNEILATDTGVVEVNGSEGVQTIAFAKIVNTDWHVGIAIPQHAVTAPAAEMQRSGLVVSVVVATLACVAALYLSRRIVHPLRQLVFGVKHFAEGDLTYQMDLQANNEVGELAKAFNTMAGKLFQRERRLKQTIDEMRIEIDVGNKVKEVKRITETDYFRYLQTSARELKAMLKE